MSIRKHNKIDKVRASRDGHEFHEAWAARKALQLVMPTDGLVGVAVEGLAPVDQVGASAETVEIADLVLYYGNHPTFNGANSVVVAQLKYSKGSESVLYRASNARKTIQKFAAAFKSHKRRLGAKNVEKKLSFELITNRPIAPGFQEALDGLAFGSPLKGDAKKQATQFTSACRLKGKELAQFAQKFKITGLAGSLRHNKQCLSRVLVDWSAAPDAMARARLGNMRQLLREKAGLAGEGKNVITRTDILDALELQSAEDLFPCPASFPKVGKIVQREQLATLASKIPKLKKPLMIHADGGAGKTVFLQSLVNVLAETHETVLFDCFGGGRYRAPEDARHLPKRGLIHIINNLACDGLCDPLLPNNENVEDLIKAFRVRLAQAVRTLQRASPDRQLLLFIDAIDNAALHAKDKNQLAFPQLLLESFHHNGHIPGVRLIVSCRTHRRDISRGNIPCEEFQLKPFSLAEAKTYLRDRIPKVTDPQIQVAYSRSQGNPRILEHLALGDRGLLEPSGTNEAISLDDLLKGRIQQALDEALKRGYTQADISAFLAGLSILPPPVPLDEYADAHGMDLGAIKSFAADLAPLLEQTKHGLMFRDEPTETLVREVYAAKTDTQRVLVDNLFKKQGTSVYAASALPGLLEKLDDGKLLFDLAFDGRFPAAITSIIGKHNIRYARLKAAALHAARKKDFGHLIHLLLELSTLAAVNQRGIDYILESPDLIVASHDVDATRRLFETRTHWPGTRHARLTIANVLSGDMSDAYRHAVNADEWIRHFYRQSDDYRRNKNGPEKLDIAAIPLCLIAQKREHDAARFLKGWKDWYVYEVSEHVFTLLRQAERMGTVSTGNIRSFLDALKGQVGVLAGALSFLELDSPTQRHLIGEISVGCDKAKIIGTSQTPYQERNYRIQNGLLKAAAVAVSINMHRQALVIVKTIPNERPLLWTFIDRFSDKNILPFIIYTAVRAAAEEKAVALHSLLPQELIDIGARISSDLKGDELRKAFKAELEKDYQSQKGLPDDKKRISYDTVRAAERFIDERLEPMLESLRALTSVLASAAGKGDKPFVELVGVWERLRMNQDRYSSHRETNFFFDSLGREILAFSVWARGDLKPSSVEVLAKRMSEVAPVSFLVELISVLSERSGLQEAAGAMAVKAKALIEHEDEVGYRSSLFARLSRAIMPASVEEATAYFRTGLEQMDAIGSGDYQFTNELLLFAGELRGDELGEAEFHALSNICELNMASEEEKFPWVAFSRGLAKTSGCRTLSKLGRWSDRDKISLNYTLLPYLAALVEQDKMDPAIALGLLHLSNPAEFYSCGTKHLAELIASKGYANSKELINELILQFEQNHPGIFMPDTLATLQKIAEREFGADSEQNTCLTEAVPHYEKLRNEEGDNRNYHGAQSSPLVGRQGDQEQENRRALKKIEDETDPSDEASMSRAIDALNSLRHVFDLKNEFLENLRGKLNYAKRAEYIQIIARLEKLDIYTKLHELKECKEKWGTSSAAIKTVFRDIGVSLIQIHADEFVRHDYLSGSDLKEIAELSGIPMPELALELLAIFAESKSHVPASVWMKLAAIICQRTKEGEGQAALSRLLSSNSAKLASSVADGAWKDGLYPKGKETDIAAGLVWLELGAPSAACRWRAAHTIRCFARLGKWEVMDALVGRFHSTDAHPYQAPELSFYFLHARLWLLIAIARLAMDYPQKVAKYAETLRAVALDKDRPHVLMRHFAAQALLSCGNAGALSLSREEVKAFREINVSPFPQKKAEKTSADSFYKEPRPASMPKPARDFHLEYDFDKYEVTSVSEIFNRSRWETKDAITARVSEYDPNLESMHDDGGRSVRDMEMSDSSHRYGQQLGWHALFLVAGEFLAKYPTFQRRYHDGDSWHEWLNRKLLTRCDGLWLADGVDRPPVNAQVNLYEKGPKGLILTSDRAKLLCLLNIGTSIMDVVVVAGNWRSYDDIEIRIRSALAPSRDARKLAGHLSKEDPFQVWLPTMEEYGANGEYLRSEKMPFVPWVVQYSGEARLDDTDPFGVISADRRLRFTDSINTISSLRSSDPFRRTWVYQNEDVAVRSEAWRCSMAHGRETSGERLVCSTRFLRDVLMKQGMDLLVLVVLQRYEEGSRGRPSQFWHSTAIVRITKMLDFEFYPGAVNKLHDSKF